MTQTFKNWSQVIKYCKEIPESDYEYAAELFENEWKKCQSSDKLPAVIFSTEVLPSLRVRWNK
jgi:hypothetical protein